MMNPIRSLLLFAALPALTHVYFGAEAPDADGAIIVEAESGEFTGWVDKHSCWHNVMLTDEPHSTFSGTGLVDTPNKVGSFVEVAYDAKWKGPHRITVRYTHIKPDPRPGQLWINGKEGPILKMPQNKALPALNTDSAVVDLALGKNLIRVVALNEGGLGNTDYVKVAEVRELPKGALPRIKVLEAEDGLHEGKIDHHSCWNFIAQHEGEHTGFTGEGYVDTDNHVDSFVTMKVDVPKAGKYHLSARYVHGKEDTRAAKVQVNGEVVHAGLKFPPTGHWTLWTYVNMPKPVVLKQGENTLRFTATGAEGLANLDHVKLTPVPKSNGCGAIVRGRVGWCGVL